MNGTYRFLAIGCMAVMWVLPRLDAQIDDIAELYGGYNLTHASPDPTIPKVNLSGFVFGAGAFANRWFGIDFEASKQYGTASAAAGAYAQADLHESSYMGGPQFRFLNRKQVNATFRALLGGVQGQVFQPGSTASQTRFALMIGAGVDVGITRMLALRIEPGLYRTSFSHENQNGFRVSVGPVFRFGSHE